MAAIKLCVVDPLDCRRIYFRVSRFEEEAQAKEVETQLKSGVIRPSQSPWAFPVVMVKKKDGTLRFCVDYRKLNQDHKEECVPSPSHSRHVGFSRRSTIFYDSRYDNRLLAGGTPRKGSREEINATSNGVIPPVLVIS